MLITYACGRYTRAFRISWAIEAAKRPVTASFSASMSAFWICLRSVRSTTVPMKRVPYLISVALFEERSPLTAEPANNVWGLDSSSNLYRFNNQAQNWTQIVGTLKQISAGANGSVWGVDSADNVYQFVEPLQPTNAWHAVPGALLAKWPQAWTATSGHWTAPLLFIITIR